MKISDSFVWKIECLSQHDTGISGSRRDGNRYKRLLSHGRREDGQDIDLRRSRSVF